MPSLHTVFLLADIPVSAGTVREREVWSQAQLFGFAGAQDSRGLQQCAASMGASWQLAAAAGCVRLAEHAAWHLHSSYHSSEHCFCFSALCAFCVWWLSW
jgi:hypothetical protein